jgi:hypothetical protein
VQRLSRQSACRTESFPEMRGFTTPRRSDRPWVRSTDELPRGARRTTNRRSWRPKLSRLTAGAPIADFELRTNFAITQETAMHRTCAINDLERIQDLCLQLQTAVEQFRGVASARIRDRLAERIFEIRAELFVLGYTPLATATEPAMVSNG